MRTKEEVFSRLRKWGCEVDESIARFVSDEQFYYDSLIKYSKRIDLESLEAAVKIRDTKEAFAIAHDLKGMIANMGITPLYEIISSLVEELRSGRIDNLEFYFASLYEKRAYLIEILGI